MRGTVPVLALFTLLVSGAALATEIESAELEFSFPSEASGEVTAVASGRGYAFGQGGSLELHAKEARIVEERVFVFHTTGDVVEYARGQEVERRERGVFYGVEARLQAGGSWGIQVSNAAWSVRAHHLTLVSVVPAKMDPDAALPQQRPQPLVRPMGPVMEDQIFSTLHGRGALLEWTGDATIELFGWRGAIHHDGGDEPIESGRERVTAGTPEAEAFVLTYVLMDAKNATIRPVSPSWQAMAGTAALHATVTGNLTLTDVEALSVETPLKVSSDGSWQARGKTLIHVQPMAENRAKASVTGDIERLAVGGHEIVLEHPGIVVAAAAPLGAALVGLLFKAVGGVSLFTRLTPAKALEHERRRQLYECIKEKPGANFRELVRETGIPAGTCRHHLNVLRRSDLIVEKQHGAAVRFFENHGRYEHDWETVAVLRDPELNRIHGWLKANPGVMQKEFLECAEAEWGWSRSTAQHRLKRLQDSGLLEVKQYGRSKHYEARDTVRKAEKPFHPLTWRG